LGLSVLALCGPGGIGEDAYVIGSGHGIRSRLVHEHNMALVK